MSQLVFLHGWLGSPGDWSEIVRLLPDSPAGCLSLPRATSWQRGVESLIGELPDSCILVGYSLGARLALACALAAGVRLRGLVLISGNPGLPAELRQQRWDHDCGVIGRLRSQPIDQFLRKWYAQDVFSGLMTDQIERLVKEKSCLDPDRQADLMSAFSVSRQPDFWPRLPRIDVPLQVVAGERDAKYRQIADRIGQTVANARIHVVAGAGHVVHREQPRALANLLQQFIQSVNEESLHT